MRAGILLGLAACASTPDLAGEWRLQTLEIAEAGALLYIGEPIAGSEQGRLTVSETLQVELAFEVDTVGAPPPWTGFLSGTATREAGARYTLDLRGRLCQGVQCEGQPSRAWTCDLGPAGDWFREVTCDSPAMGGAVAAFLKP